MANEISSATPPSMFSSFYKWKKQREATTGVPSSASEDESFLNAELSGRYNTAAQFASIEESRRASEAALSEKEKEFSVTSKMEQDKLHQQENANTMSGVIQGIGAIGTGALAYGSLKQASALNALLLKGGGATVPTTATGGIQASIGGVPSYSSLGGVPNVASGTKVASLGAEAISDAGLQTLPEAAAASAPSTGAMELAASKAAADTAATAATSSAVESANVSAGINAAVANMGVDAAATTGASSWFATGAGAGLAAAAPYAAAAAAVFMLLSSDKISDVTGSIICTELNRQGYLSDDLLMTESIYRKLHIEQDTYNGYIKWAKYIVPSMRKSRVLSKIISVPVKYWANEMASRISPDKYKGNLIGKVMFKIGIPICTFLGRRNGKCQTYSRI